MRRLVAQRTLVQRIPEQTQGENRHGEPVAAVPRIAAGEFGQRVVLVFRACCGVPESGIEHDAAGSDCERFYILVFDF